VAPPKETSITASRKGGKCVPFLALRREGGREVSLYGGDFSYHPGVCKKGSGFSSGENSTPEGFLFVERECEAEKRKRSGRFTSIRGRANPFRAEKKLLSSFLRE